MQNSNEQKTNIFQRFINTTIKFTKDLTNEFRSKSPDEKFKYELPDSFLKAVDKARLEAGCDILPRRRARSVSPTISLSSSSSSSSLSNSNYASNPNLTKVSSTKKVAFRRSRPRQTPPAQVRQQNVQPRFFSARPRFPLAMNPNMMMINRPHRPVNIPPTRMRVPMFQMRFR